MAEDLNSLVNKSIFIIRETLSSYKNPAVMWSTGKDSTAMLHLIKQASPDGNVPVPVIHIDTTFKFKEIYEYRDRMAKEWNLNLIVAKNNEALESGVGPKTNSKFDCCTKLKTEALKQVIKKYKFDALIMSIRRDEHGIRAMERVMSPRDQNFRWNIAREKKQKSGDSPFEALQPTEIWELYQTDFGESCDHVRVHPILHWTELDIWRFIQENNIPMNPLYFAKNGQRYRSLGCECCTRPVKSDADTMDKIIKELETTKIAERSGRAQDKEDDTVMQRLRAMGYM